MQKNDERTALLNEHEELVSLYIHENKIMWNLISVYIALNVGLATAVITLLNYEVQRMGAVVFVCSMGCMFSIIAAILFKTKSDQISEWVKKGGKVEEALKEMSARLEVFKICERFLEKKTFQIIHRGMWFLACLWFVTTIGMLFSWIGWLQVPFFP